jgi:hypothetical protein
MDTNPWSAEDAEYEKACDLYNDAHERRRAAQRQLREAEAAMAVAGDDLENVTVILRDAETAASRGIGGIFTGARREQLDAETAADLEATRRDVLRAYLSDLESTTRELAGLHPEDTYYGGQAEILAAVASFMDGQQDGSVTRG